MTKRKHFKFWKRWIMPAAIVFCMTALPALAQVTITGPSESLAGDLVVLSVEFGVGSEESKEDNSQLAWTIVPDDVAGGKYHIADGGRTLVFASRLEGTYHFILAAKSGPSVYQIKHKLENKSLAPIPTPGPTPTPEPLPDPVLPEPDHTAIGKYASEKAKELVKSQFFDREKNALGEAFLATAKQIDRGEIESGEDARTGLRKNTLTYLNSVSRDAATNWQTWNTALGDELARYKLDDLTEIGKVYKTIGVSLVNVKTPSASDCADGKCPAPTPTRNYRRW